MPRVGSYRIPTENPIRFHKDFNKIGEVLWDSGTRTYSQILSVEIRSDPVLELNRIQHKRIVLVFC